MVGGAIENRAMENGRGGPFAALRASSEAGGGAPQRCWAALSHRRDACATGCRAYEGERGWQRRGVGTEAPTQRKGVIPRYARNDTTAEAAMGAR